MICSIVLRGGSFLIGFFEKGLRAMENVQHLKILKNVFPAFSQIHLKKKPIENETFCNFCVLFYFIRILLYRTRDMMDMGRRG